MVDVTIRSLLSEKNVIVVYPYHHDEIASPIMGATRLIHEQIVSLRNEGYNVNLVSTMDIGSLTSFIAKQELRLRQKRSVAKVAGTSESQRWWLNLVIVIAAEIVSRLDVLFTIRLEKKLKEFSYPAVLIYNYPRGLIAFSRVTRRLKVRLAIYEHNIEWKFFESNIGNTRFGRFLIRTWKKMEIRALQRADHIICANRNDFNLLSQSIDDNKLRIWIPSATNYSNDHIGAIDVNLKQRLANSFVVGFVGTNFGPNITSARNIIHISKKLLDTRIVFLVIGNVSEAFDNDEILQNVIFTNYVSDLVSYLSLCDAFINPKTTSDTGIEVKMLDYLKFDKPILTTRLGASGFENYKNLIIVEDLSNVSQLLIELAKMKKMKTI